MRPVILASCSPRRSDLLSRAGVRFETVSPGSDEMDTHAHPGGVPILNAVSKAEAVAASHPGAITIGADTVIEFQGDILGKPGSLEGAVEMLARLSGKSHLVTTGVCLLCPEASVRCVFAESSEVVFKSFGPETARRYAALVDTLDKAGAYAAQERADMIIESINGPLDNVVGLPVEKLLLALKACRVASEK